MSSSVWIVLSDCLSIFGWAVVLRCILVPKASCNCRHDLKTKWGSQSETILMRTPCKLTILSRYSLASFSNKYSTFTSKNGANFVSLSVIIQIASWLFYVLGNPVTKSIVMCSHFHFGTSKDCSSLDNFWCFALTYWQVKQVVTNWAISIFKSSQQ